MFTNVFSNFNSLIEAFDASKAVGAPFGTKKYRSMLRSIEQLISDDSAPSNSIVTELALSLYSLLQSDSWSLTDRDLFNCVSDVTEASFGTVNDYQALCKIVHCLAYLPLDVEGNGTPARRYKEVMCSVVEDSYRHLYELGAAIAVFMFIVVRITSPDSSMRDFLSHHWRSLKTSHNATLSVSLLKHSPTAYYAAQKSSCAGQAHILVKWTAETLACVYSRIYVPAVLENYGNLNYRDALARYVVGGCHEDN